MSTQTENIKLDKTAKTGLLVLGLLQTLMLAALYTRTTPHPPLEIALFALGPFLSMSIALAFAAYHLASGRLARGLAIAACLTALVSYGPHKYFDAAFPLIWPAVILAQLAVIAVLAGVVREARSLNLISN